MAWWSFAEKIGTLSLLNRGGGRSYCMLSTIAIREIMCLQSDALDVLHITLLKRLLAYFKYA